MQKWSLKLFKSYFSTYLGFSTHCYFGFILSFLESIFIGIYYYLSIYFVDILRYDMSTAGIIISCYGIGAILGGIVGGKISDHWTPGIVSACSLFIQAIVYFIFTQVQAIHLLMINVFTLGIASYGFITANHLFVLDDCRSSEDQRLRAISILFMTSNLGLGISALILGGVLSWLSSCLFIYCFAHFYSSLCIGIL